MKPKYEHCRIEQKWQKHWDDQKIFRAEVDHTKPKYYVLDMFPYPSGSGLHVGHVTGYTATDIMARYKRLQGFNVLHPMGWDSFGLPAEQYAIRTGTHPSITTEQNINTYRRQLKSLGFSYDWDREVATSDPTYYKWTQWIFTKLYEKGLAYEAEMLVNFCPALGTVLANEEVEDGKSKEGGHEVVRKPLRQWVLKITAYAERLLQDLDLIDWPDHLKKLQRNWIGKSEGAKIDFHIEKSRDKITVFTTRHDTLFGVSYLVLAPEHPLVKELVTPAMQAQVASYQKEVAAKSDLMRTDLAKEKTGVFTGSYAIHPLTKQPIPIWIADYVLMGYGTGAVMGVAAHDERDYEFAKKFKLAILPVLKPCDGSEASEGCWTSNEAIVTNSASEQLDVNGLTVEEAQEKIVAYLEAHHLGTRSINYKLRDWLFSRQRYWGEPFPILHCEDGSKRILDIDELPLCPPQLADFKPSETGESPLAKVKEWVFIKDPKTGKMVQRETNTMPQWAGSCWYYLRFCDPQNEVAAWDKEVEKYWMPVDLYVGGVEHAVLHLLYARFWHKVLFDAGLVSTSEPFQTLRNQGLITARSYQMPSSLAYLLPEEAYEKEGQYYQRGSDLPLNSQIEKMSKSKLNGVTPDEMIEEVGADALRMYEMFMGPFDKEKIWNSDAVQGCKRFLNRYFDLIVSEKVTEEETTVAMKLIHKLVKQVEHDIEDMQFNTAIAKMMQFMNEFAPLELYPKSALKMLTQILNPFAPHITEEAWELLGQRSNLPYEPFPRYEEKYLQEDVVTVVVQINGKMRGNFEIPKDYTQEEVLDFVQGQSQVARYLTGEIKKVVYVQNKLINIVI